MSWFLTIRLAEGLYCTTEPAVHDFWRANAFTVRGRDADLQVDFLCGFAPLRPALPRTGKPVVAVATHAHVDHVGGFHEFADRRGPAAEAAAFAAMTPQAVLQDWLREERDGPALARPPARGFRLADWAPRPAPLTALLAEGDVVDLGDRRFRALHLPGHSPGSLGLFDEAAGLLLTGDAIYDDGIIDDLPGSSVPDYLSTMERLSQLDFALALGGHGPPMTRARLRVIAEAYIRSRS